MNNLNWVEIVVSILSGLAVCIPLVVKLVQSVKAAVQEKNWSQIVAIVLDLMQQAGVTEEQLRAAGEISSAMGETLSWPYLCWVREHPLHWKVPTQVLYADTDPLTGHTAMEQFRRQTGAHLTILEGGEHWFHTETQLAALQSWESYHL